MRDYEIGPKEEGEYRILCLGDSFTFGLGVNIPEAYPKVLERLLARENRPIRVLNGGTAGNAEDAYEFLESTGLGFKPDLAVIQVYIGNDFYDGMRRLEARAGEQNASRAAEAKAAPDFLGRFKAAVRGLRLRTPEFLWGRLIQIRFIDDFLYQRNLRYDNRGIFLRQYPPVEEALVRRELSALRKLKALCVEKNIGVVFFIVPTKQQLFKKHFLSDEKYDYRKPNDVLKEFCREEDAPCLDLLDFYETLPENTLESFYFTRDRHWTVRGHVYAGQALAGFLERLRIMPAVSGMLS